MPALLQQGLAGFGCVHHGTAEVHPLRADFQGSPVDPRQVEQVLGQAGEVARLAGGGIVAEAGAECGAITRVEAQAGRLFGAVLQPVIEKAVEQRAQLGIGAARGRLRQCFRRQPDRRQGSAR